MLGNFTRCTWSFRDNASSWTENWIYNGLVSQTIAYQIMNAYLTPRMLMMGVGLWCDFYRATLLNGTGVSFKAYPNVITTVDGKNPNGVSNAPLGAGVQGVQPTDNSPPDRPYSALMFTFVGAQGQSRKLFASGIPDDVITDPFGPTFKPGYANAIFNWRTQGVFGNQLGWLGTTGPGAQPKAPITVVTAGTPGSVTAPTSTVAAGDTVHIGGFRGYKGFRWTGQVISNVGGVITVAGYNPPSGYIGKGGYIQKTAYQFILATGGDYGRETHRNRGKGLLAPVGRRRARHN